MNSMIVNTLPSPTWNWLHMNEQTIEDFPKLEEGAVLIEVPQEVEAEVKEAFTTSNVKTGMGEEFLNMIENSGIDIDYFEAKGDTRVSEPLRVEIEYQDQVNAVNAAEILVPEGSHLVCVMNFTSDDKACGNAAMETLYHVAKNASLTLIQVTSLIDEVNFFNDIGGECDEKGEFSLIQVVLGGKKTYLGSHTALSGYKSRLSTDLAYLVKGNSGLDVNYVASHTGKKTGCDIRANGVLRDHGQKMFRGTIDFVKGCAGAVGSEVEDVLLMDETVSNQTIPVILCAEEDVEGTHGATIGKLPEDLMFYLKSRGMSEKAIYEMMAIARIEAVADKITDEKTRTLIANRLGKAEEV